MLVLPIEGEKSDILFLGFRDEERVGGVEEVEKVGEEEGLECEISRCESNAKDIADCNKDGGRGDNCIPV
jgi:hypothetical protein